jgi:hypothetical protein
VLNGGGHGTDGDALNLALAAAQSYQVNGTPASGNVTSSNLNTLTFSNFESGPNIDAVAPSMVAADINLNGIPGLADAVGNRQAVGVQFSENVSALLSPSWLQLTNTTTSQPVPTANIAVEYDTGTNTAHFTFPGYPLGILPDGDYSGKILAGLPDLFGNGLPADAPFSFFFLQGDANHDRRVNLTDFNILAANFGGSNKTFSQGDFNYDGQTNLADFNILAGKFGAALGPDAGDGGASFSRESRSLRDLMGELLV